MLYSGAIDAIANHAGELYFFPIPDYALKSDSSLIINWINKDEDLFSFQVLNKLTHQVENVGSSTIRNWILNQVGISTTGVSGGIETIRTLGGNYISPAARRG
jgi:hypothetical protein